MFRRLTRRNLIVHAAAASLALSAVTACEEKAPPQARQTLQEALSALAGNDEAAFLATLPPGQRDAAPKLPEWEHFMAVKKGTIDSALQVEDSTLKMTVMLYFDDAEEVFNTVTFVMTKEGSSWLVDLKETIALAKRLNGPNAFSKWKLEPAD